MNYQANVNAIAQQAREQQLKQKQAAVKAEVELDRLKGLLHREQALQVFRNPAQYGVSRNCAALPNICLCQCYDLHSRAAL